MGSLLISLLICLAINAIVSVVIYQLVPNYYLASMLISIIIAFIYAILTSRDKKHFFKDVHFWIYFFVAGIIFLLMDCFSFIL